MTHQTETSLEVGEILNAAWELMLRRIWMFVLAGLLLLMVQVGLNYGLQAELVDLSLGPGTWVLLILLAFVGWWALVGVINVSLMLRDGRDPKIRDLFPPADATIRAIATQLLLFLATLAGTVALIVPGIYIFVRYLLAVSIAVDQPVGPTVAFRMAGELLTGRWWWFAGLQAAVLLITVIVNLLTLGLGGIVMVPYSMIVNVEAYRRLQAVQGPSGSVATSMDQDGAS